MPWTMESVNQLKTLCDDGLSYARIAAELSMSRGAVIGKASRLGLSKRYATATVTRRVPARVPAPVLRMVEREPGDYRCVFDELTSRKCRYPLWPITPTPMAQQFYCGVPDADITIDRPYCSVHEKLCLRHGPEAADVK